MTTESILALARIIADRDREIAALKRTLGSTAQVAAKAEQRCGSACAALDAAWRRIHALRIHQEFIVSPESYAAGIGMALRAIEDLGGMDPAEREADAVSAEHSHKKWSKSP